MRLYITEKKSVAAELAKCLPNPVLREGYYETGDGLVTWSQGHMLKLAEPEEYDEKYTKWKAEDLPILPEQWKFNIISSAAAQFKVVRQLIEKATEIVHGGDPDKEGQEIVDRILLYSHNKKPVKRILLNALDEKSIKKALGNVRDNKEFFNLSQCAVARARADWIIGMNLTRAYTLAAQKAGHKDTMVIGRVKAPTLSLVVRREREINDFTPHDYYVLMVPFRHSNGAFHASWVPKDTQVGLDSEGRLINKSIAEELIRKLRSEKTPAVVDHCETEEKKEANRLPYSLSALQIEAGKKYGYDPQTVLDTAQKLYEKKLTTYPRSDCDFLPESQLEDAALILDNLKRMGNRDLADWSERANLSIKSRAWNDSKITAHHALIPTCQYCNYDNLSPIEKDIYFMIAQAYIAQFYPIHIYDSTKIIVSFSEEEFKVTGKTVKQDGWKEIFKETAETKLHPEEENNVLPIVKINDVVDYMAAYILEKRTKAPSRFTATTLLQAMKEIHKFVKNQELKKQLKDVSGIGTEATRATIIKDLMDRGFLITDKKYLIPSERAYVLIDILPEQLTYPDSTAQWEMAFSEIMEGRVKMTDFISGQSDFVKELCQAANLVTMKRATLEGQPCPTCGNGVLQLKHGKTSFWGCSCFPECRATFPDKKGKPDLEPPTACPVCGKGVLRFKDGTKGKFWSCSDYQECKATFDNYRNKPLLTRCPDCNTGFLKKRNGAQGEFFGCSSFPSCRYSCESDKGKPDIKKGGAS